MMRMATKTTESLSESRGRNLLWLLRIYKNKRLYTCLSLVVGLEEPQHPRHTSFRPRPSHVRLSLR